MKGLASGPAYEIERAVGARAVKFYVRPRPEKIYARHGYWSHRDRYHDGIPLGGAPRRRAPCFYGFRRGNRAELRRALHDAHHGYRPGRLLRRHDGSLPGWFEGVGERNQGQNYF